MADTRGRGGLGWFWPLTSLMILLGVFMVSLAFMFPQGIKFDEKSTVDSAATATPAAPDTINAELQDIMNDPVPYYDKDVVLDVRITDIWNDRIIWIGTLDDVSQELFGVIASGIDMRATDYKIYQIMRVYGTVRKISDDDLKAQGLIIGSRTAQVISSGKAYLLIRGVVPANPGDPIQYPPTATATPEPTDTPEPTFTPEPTDTPEPTITTTFTPEPTDTPEPTFTPEPTDTPEPTFTPEPTDTPEPTPSMQVIPGTGMGDVTVTPMY